MLNTRSYGEKCIPISLKVHQVGASLLRQSFASTMMGRLRLACGAPPWILISGLRCQSSSAAEEARLRRTPLAIRQPLRCPLAAGSDARFVDRLDDDRATAARTTSDEQHVDEDALGVYVHAQDAARPNAMDQRKAAKRQWQAAARLRLVDCKFVE